MTTSIYLSLKSSKTFHSKGRQGSQRKQYRICIPVTWAATFQHQAKFKTSIKDVDDVLMSWLSLLFFLCVLCVLCGSGFFRLFCFIHDLAADHRQQRFEIFDLVRGHCQIIAV